MEYDNRREDFLDRMVEICRLLGIDAPQDQDSGTIAYLLDIDEVTFLLEHSISDSPGTMLVQCQFGRVPQHDRLTALTLLLQLNTSLAEQGFGAICLDAEGQTARCMGRIDLARTDRQVLATLLAIRNIARDWHRQTSPFEAMQGLGLHIIP